MNNQEITVPAQLLDILGLVRPGNHGPCRFCNSRDALSVHLQDRWRWKCHSCGLHGDTADALALAERISLKDALARLKVAPVASTKSFKHVPKPPAEPVAPILDRDRAYPVFEKALLNILEGRANHCLGIRGITRVWVDANPNLGFIERATIDGWKTPLVNAWVIRVTTPDGQAVALKVHREKPPEGCPKSCWLPFGTEPKEKPRHGFATLWPSPEWFGNDRLYLCPGELKAAAMCSAGLSATSITTGESFRWTPGSLARFMGRKVCIVFDDDTAGHKFRDTTKQALMGIASQLQVISFGKKESK